MVQVTYPGVYIQEVPSGVRTITSVATSITAFIDFFREGPMNQAVEIFGMGDFERIFGGLDDRSEASYAIAQFYLNGGGTALVVRTAASDAGNPLAKASVRLKASAAAAAAEILILTAANEGVWGNNLRAEVDYATTDPATLFNLTVTRYDGSGGTAKPLAVERFLNLTMDSTKPRSAVKVINDGSKLVVASPGAGAGAATRPAPTGTVSTSLAALTPALYNGFAGNTISVAIGAATATVSFDNWAGGTVTTLPQLRAKLEQAIRSGNPALAASKAAYAGATVELVGDTLVVHAGRGAANYAATETVVIANSGDTTATDLGFVVAGSPNVNVQQYALGSGAAASVAALVKGTTGGDGLKPGAAEILGSQAVEPHSGMYALDYADLFNILCIPRTADLGDTEMVSAVSGVLKYCEDRRAFFILDIPADKNEVQEIKDWLDAHGTFRNKNAAIYFPRPRIPDPKNEFRLRSVGASGTMAGLYARTDANRGVWKAPAGTEVQTAGVVEFDAKLTDAQNGTLNPLGINCLRSMPVYGNVVWGARTLEGADQMGSEWKYIPIRRLALMLEESLFRGTKWVVFEPNDEPLWARIRLNVGAYMMSLFRQGAFQGASPKEAFFVKCDGETTTQDDRNKGIVNILVGFAPLKPAEFVVISIQQIAGDL